jgi:rubrerythrin
MGYLPYNADEAFEIAEQIERNGARFYRRAAEIVVDQEAQKLLLALAEAEDEHEDTFVRLRNRLVKEKNTFDPDGEGASYLQSIANSKVFEANKDASVQFSGNETLEYVLRWAISREKDTVMFFLAIKESALEKQDKDQIDAIVREELSHVALLSKALASILP